MRIEYYPDTDSLYVYVADRASSETDVIGDGIQADFDREGSLVGVEIEHVAFYASPSTLNLALANLAENVTAEERHEVGLAFEQVLAGSHNQSDLIA